ncbi:MAG: serine hydrolase, partial [Thermomicrobiales bacterium]
DTPQGRIIGHGGSFGGFQTQLSIVPDKGFAFVFLTNSTRGSASFPPIERYMLDRFAGITLSSPPTIDLDNGALSALAGKYEHGVSEVAFSAENGTIKAAVAVRSELTGEMQNLPPIYYSPISDREFVVLDGAAEGSRLEFFDRDGKPAHFVRIGLRIAERVSA